MKRTLTPVVASALAALLLLGGCSDSDEPEEPDAAPATTAAAEESPAEETPAGGTEPALEVTTGTPKSRSCFTREVPRDLAWFDVQWKVLDDLDQFAFELVGAEGVSAKGPGFVVPPVNFGGRIDLAGSSTWEGWRAAVGGKHVSISQAESAAFWAPTEGQTGLLVLHLVFDQEALRTSGASFDGVKATYTTEDGETGEVTVETRQRFATGDAC